MTDVAVVTGAGAGIGAAIATALAASGMDLFLHCHSHTRAIEAVAAACRQAGSQVEVAQADFSSDPSLAAAIVDSAAERYGRVDVLVNNAAITTLVAPFEAMTREMLETTLAVNAIAPFLATQAAARHMIARGNGGRVINIGSVHGRTAAPGFAAYEMSKAAIAALTRASAIALGQHGITVNCVAPGTIVVERYGEADWDQPWVVSRTPIGRTGLPRDIAAAVAFLASDASGFLTAETITVDGGMTRRMALVR